MKKAKKKVSKKRGFPMRMILRGQSGPKISFKKDPKHGYKIYVKYFMRDPELVGTVYRHRVYKVWCAFKWEDPKPAGGTLVYVKGAETRKKAVAALMAIL